MARPFGQIETLPSGRLRASFPHPSNKETGKRKRVYAPTTYKTEAPAKKWLRLAQVDIERGVWVDPAAVVDVPETVETFRTYAAREIPTRRSKGHPLRAKTREGYDLILRVHLNPAFGDLPLDEITPAMVKRWYDTLTTGPAMRAEAYRLLGSVLAAAVNEDLIPTNPCRVKGGGTAPDAKKVEPLTPDQFDALVAALPAKYRTMTLMAAYCSLRYGEVSALERGDIDLEAGVVHIRRGAVKTKGGLTTNDPKTEAGKRDVRIPSNIHGAIQQHLDEHAGPVLLFPNPRTGGLLTSSTFAKAFAKAAATIELPDGQRLPTPHGLRHAGQTWAAANGAELAELMERAGQVSPTAALRYIKATKTRQREIADRLSTYRG